MPVKTDEATEQEVFIFQLKRAEFSEQAQKLYKDLENLRNQVEKYTKISWQDEGEIKKSFEKIKIDIENKMRYIIKTSVTFFTRKDELELLRIDKEKDKFETERALLNNQIKQLKVETYPEPKLPKYIISIAVALFSLGSTMLGMFLSIFKVDWEITLIFTASIYVIAIIFLYISLKKINDYDNKMEKMYDELFSEFI